MYLKKLFLLFFYILSQVYLQLCFGFPDPFLRSQAMSLLSPQDTYPCLHCLCILGLFFSLSKRSCLSQAGLLPPLPTFLHVGIKSSCAQRKIFLDISQLSFSPLPLRTVSQGIPSTRARILPFWGLGSCLNILPVLYPSSLRIPPGHDRCSPSYPQCWPLWNSWALVNNRPSSVSPVVEIFVTESRKLSSQCSVVDTWIACVLLCCFSSRCLCGWSPLSGSWPTPAMLPAAEGRTLHQHPRLDGVACVRH